MNLLLGATMILYGAYMVFLYFSGKVQLLIHQDYAILPLLSGIFLIVFGGIETVSSIKEKTSPEVPSHSAGGVLLLFVVIVGAFLVPPAPLSSSTALIRKGGLNDDAGLSRRTEEVPRFIINSENRHLIEWVNLFHQYPDPEEYEGQKVKVSGFVVHDGNLPDDYFMISRFVLSCCAADARPVGIPVHYDPALFSLANDEWIELRGVLATAELNGERVPVIEFGEYQPIDVPENPYATI